MANSCRDMLGGALGAIGKRPGVGRSEQIRQAAAGTRSEPP